MKDHRMTIASRLNIGLDMAEAERHSPFKCEGRILDTLTRATPVGQGNRWTCERCSILARPRATWERHQCRTLSQSILLTHHWPFACRPLARQFPERVGAARRVAIPVLLEAATPASR